MLPRLVRQWFGYEYSNRYHGRPLAVECDKAENIMGGAPIGAGGGGHDPPLLEPKRTGGT